MGERECREKGHQARTARQTRAVWRENRTTDRWIIEHSQQWTNGKSCLSQSPGDHFGAVFAFGFYILMVIRGQALRDGSTSNHFPGTSILASIRNKSVTCCDNQRISTILKTTHLFTADQRTVLPPMICTMCMKPASTTSIVARSGRASESERRVIKGGKGSVFDFGKGARGVSAHLLALTSCTLGPKSLTSRR